MTAAPDIGPARTEELKRVFRCLADTFEGSRMRGLFEAEINQAKDSVECLVARTKGVVASSLFAWKLPVFVPPSPECRDVLEIQPVMGIASLVTFPSFRGQGLGTALLEWASRWAEDQGCFGLALFSEIGPRYYAERGFTAAPIRFYRGAMPPMENLTVAPAAGAREFVPDDLPEVAKAYAATARRYPLAVARDLDYWRRHLARLLYYEDMRSTGSTRRDFIVADDLSAYVRSRHDGDIFTLLEAACLPGAEEVLLALIRREMARAAKEGCVRITIHLPPGMVLPPGLVLRETRYETFMLRPIPRAEWIREVLTSGRVYVFRMDYF